jgi:TrpR-related protein YerC/YecD
VKWDSKENKRLIKAILSLETPDEVRRFLRDLMTENEIVEFSKRLRAAELLTEKVPYSTIERETGLSSTTVARVSKWLNKGEGGYKKIISRLHHHDSIQSRRGLS